MIPAAILFFAVAAALAVDGGRLVVSRAARRRRFENGRWPFVPASAESPERMRWIGVWYLVVAAMATFLGAVMLAR